MESLSLIVVLVMVVSSQCLATYDISDYQLITKDRPNAGIVQVYTQDRGWGLICIKGYWKSFGFDLASAVCRHLNFPGTSRHLTAAYFEEEGDGWSLSVTNNISTYYSGCSISQMNIQCDTYDNQDDCKPSSIGAVTCKEPGYLGCYSDYFRDEDRVFSNRTDFGQLTVHLCITMCQERGFFYAGVEYTNECYCGRQDEDYSRHGGAPDGNCQYPCGGDRLETCGGTGRISIYQVNLGVCEDPRTQENGFMFGDSLRYGSKVYFNCSDGFVLDGPDVIQCVKTYVSRKNISGESNSTHAVIWNDSFQSCTGVSTTISPTATTERGALTSSAPFLGTVEPVKQEGDQLIIYISIGIVVIIVILIVIIAVVVLRKMHNKRQGKRLGSAAPVTDNTVASRNDGNGGGSPLMPRRDEEDLFALSVLTSHSNTDGENHYVDGSEERQPTHPGLADRSANAREAFGYESIRLPSGNSALTMGAVPVGGATDLYANTDFHEVPSNLVDNELYG